MNALTVKGFEQFWCDLESVSQAVLALLVHGPAAELRQLTTKVRQGCEHAIQSRTMELTEQILTALAVTSLGYLYSKSDPPEWFDNYLNAPKRGRIDAESATSRIDEFLMEQLTAAWLVLYFLGVPMGHPWERVRRIADEQGGYPAGACMTKLIGDVYRRSRLEFDDTVPGNADAAAPYVLVLSKHPSLLIEELLARHDDMKITPGTLHQLGRCYALFQLRLYIAEGRPLRYMITLPVLKRSLALFPQLQAIAPLDLATRIIDWLNSNFPNGPAPGQFVELHLGEDNFDMSPCTLGCRTGVVGLESGTAGTRFVGNRINKLLLSSLRHRLVHINDQAPCAPKVSTDVVQMLGMPAHMLAGRLLAL